MLKIASANNLSNLEAHGLPLMTSIRKLTVQIAKEFKQNLITMVNEDCRGWAPLYQFVESPCYPKARGRCYVCHLQECLRGKDIKRTSVIMKKLAFFLKEFVVFEACGLQEAMKECARHVEADKARFSVSEIAMLQKIQESLRVKQDSALGEAQYAGMRRAINFIEEHSCYPDIESFDINCT